MICKSVIPAKDKTIKLWKVSERDKRPEGYNLKDEEGRLKDMTTITSLQVPALACTNMIWINGKCVSVSLAVIYFFLGVFLFFFFSPSFSSIPGTQGAGAETHGSDGGGSAQTSLLQWTHLPCQLHLRQQRWGDLPVC